MKVSFPHMGNTWIALATAFKVLGADVIVPPYNNKETLNIGGKHSPEAVCLPYKLILGNYIQAIEAGAEAVIMINSPGTCRLGQYSDLCKKTLQDLGHSLKIVDLDLYSNGFFVLYDKFREVTGNRNPIDLLRAANLCILKIDLIDKLDETLNYYRAREVETGSSEKKYKVAIKKLENALTVRETKLAFQEGIEYIATTEIDREKDVISIDITGEIYVAIDAFSNQEIEKELGKLGVQVNRKIKLSNWSSRFLKPEFIKLTESHEAIAKKAAREFIKRDIGGDAIESIGDTLLAKNNKTDGVIHLLPFTCMPEIISQNIIHKVREENDIPVLSLVLDENLGKAGFITRLEAFTDLLKRRKNQKQEIIKV